MDTRIGQCLTDLVRTEGVALAEDPNRVRALLMDTCPDARTEIGLLTVAAEEDIPSRLMRSSDSVFRDGEIARAVVDLQRDRRLDPEASRWTVHQWAHALGIIDEEPVDPEPEAPAGSPATGPAEPASTATPATSQGDQRSGAAPPGTYWSNPVAGGSGGSPAWSAGGPPGPSSGSAPVGTAAMGAGPASGPPAGASPMSWPPPVSVPPGGAPSFGPPGSGPPWPQPAPGKRPPYGLMAAAGVVLILVLGVVGYVVLRSDPSDGGGGPAGTVTVPAAAETTSTYTPSPTTAEPAAITFSITDELGEGQISETVVVTSDGNELGRLKVDTTSRTDRLEVTASDGPGVYSYDLDVWFAYQDGNGEVQEAEIGGSGTINVSAGASFAVYLVARGDSYVATLRSGGN